MKLGTATAFAAEAALWISGAALIASAAGVTWNVDVNGLMAAQPSASASVVPSSSPTATFAVVSLAPGASPTMSPVVRKFLAYVARPDFQLKAKFTVSSIYTVSGLPKNVTQSGTLSYKSGDDSDNLRETVNGTVTTYADFDIGSYSYESKNGGPWTRSSRPTGDSEADRLLFAPTMTFLDRGVETKNGTQLHRLELADPSSFNKAWLKTQPELTDTQQTYTVWVRDDGTPAAYRLSGPVEISIGGTPTSMANDQEFRIFALSGVSITAPI
jgi:hypothetical protein